MRLQDGGVQPTVSSYGAIIATLIVCPYGSFPKWAQDIIILIDYCKDPPSTGTPNFVIVSPSFSSLHIVHHFRHFLAVDNSHHVKISSFSSFCIALHQFSSFATSCMISHHESEYWKWPQLVCRSRDAQRNSGPPKSQILNSRALPNHSDLTLPQLNWWLA